MEYRRLGISGLQVSAIGLGTNTFGGTADENSAIGIVQTALDLGINFIDTADTYGQSGDSETAIGKAIRGRRHEAIIATKVAGRVGAGPNDVGLSRAHIFDGVEGSLRRLGTDYIDLYQAHMPDRETPLEETLRAFDDLVHQGKVRYVGCSNYAAWQLVHARWLQDKHGLAPWVSVQPQWNLAVGLQDPALLPASRQFDIGIIPYRPMAAGMLTGKYPPGQPPPPGTRAADVAGIRRRFSQDTVAVAERLRPWAEERHHTTGELAIAWLLAHPEVSTVIVGARHPDQVRENLRAIEWAITPEDRDEVLRLAHPAV